jgi:dGTP triphosphohydrolase
MARSSISVGLGRPGSTASSVSTPESRAFQPGAGRARAVADYVAGMTDRYAILEHERMFVPGERS